MQFVYRYSNYFPALSTNISNDKIEVKVIGYNSECFNYEEEIDDDFFDNNDNEWFGYYVDIYNGKLLDSLGDKYYILLKK